MRAETVRREYQDLMFGLAEPQANAVLDELIAAARSPAELRPSVLGGRGVVSTHRLNGLGPILVKHYMRGGVLRRFVRKRYIRWGRTRPEQEYDFLRHVRGLGIKGPEPLAFIVEGGLFYRGWLVTRLIEADTNFAEVAMQSDERLPALSKQVIDQVSRLIEHKVYHVDLHPGNVLVDRAGVVHLVDFDKARFFSGTRNQLRDRYLCRWRRAVIKHDLPEALSELLSAGLRRVFEEG